MKNTPTPLQQAEIFLRQGNRRMAAGCYALAVQEDPSSIEAKKKFLQVAGTTPFLEFNAAIKEVILACLQSQELEAAHAQILWHSILRVDPRLSTVYTTTAQGTAIYFDSASFSKVRDLHPLLDAYFLKGVEKLAVYHPSFEEFITALRRKLLLQSEGMYCGLQEKEYIRLVSALSHYFFYAGYIFDWPEDERLLIDDIRNQIEAGRANPRMVALYACYQPLYAIKNTALLDDGGDDEVAGVLRAQVQAYEDLQRRIIDIVSLTAVEDMTSCKVREQYEEFPYPQWKHLSEQMQDERIAQCLTEDDPRILVAGCATGRIAVELAAAFPKAQVLGIDLSRNSLVYAESRAQRHGVSNVLFRQADILKMGGCGMTFDYIVSDGVLHHLQDPQAGLSVLSGLLRPRGLMHLALYSCHGRQRLAEVKKAIAGGGFTGTVESMRQFRMERHQRLRPELLAFIRMARDFYHMSMFRDLLFHVQEHWFDIPLIKQSLDQAGLEFDGFEPPPTVLQKFILKFPNKKEIIDLDKWNVFELENPDSFMAMYKFWCRKK